MIAPQRYYLDNGCCYDQESPLARALPTGSDDANGCGTWLVPGFSDPAARALDLLARGFAWRADFQRMWDQDVEKGQRSGMEMMAPTLEGRELEKTTQAPQAGSAFRI